MFLVSLAKKSPTLVNLYKSIKFSGSSRYCPVCSKSSSAFSSFSVPPVPPRADAECPWCGSLERHRLLMLFLEREGLLKRDRLNILHPAPEAYMSSVFQYPGLNHNYITADLLRRDVKIRLDLCDICFRDNYFHLIVCNHVLEHVQDDLLALSEMYRVLLPDGVALLTVPQDSSRAFTYEDPCVTSAAERTLKFGQADHVRVYGHDFASRVKSVGFSVREFNGSNFLTAAERGLMGITDASGSIYVCTK